MSQTPKLSAATPAPLIASTAITGAANITGAYCATYFDGLYSDNSDPWQYQTRWYEHRKRAICLALLPQAHYTNALELGCGNGVFSALLAPRCQALLSIDANAQAVQLAKQRLAPLPHARVLQGVIPNVLVDLAALELANRPPYDLIVVSEILYYLSAQDIDKVIKWIEHNLALGGTLLCCHWRYAIEGFAMTGDTVHQRLYQAFNGAIHSSTSTAAMTLHQQTQLVESDFLLDIWTNAATSVAMQENLVG